VNPFCKLDWFMHNTTQFMKSWSDRFIGNIRVQLEIAKEVVHWLEFARDRRHVLAHEEVFVKSLIFKA
jgi:hypothetical protein